MSEISGPSKQTSANFPYLFMEDGHLRHRDTLQPYKFPFDLHDLRGTAKEHTSIVGYINQYVCDVLENSFNLMKMSLDKGGEDGCHSPGFVYASPGALEDLGTLLVLIQDRGTARCGVWSWKAVARHGLGIGSQIPYVRWALRESWAVMLLNTNEGRLSPEQHVCQVWEQLLSKSLADRIAVVAHGYGGLAFVDVLCCRCEEIRDRSWVVAFIDSSHSLWHQRLGSEGRDWLQTHSRSWILSTRPTNRQVGSLKTNCRAMSAGTLCHDTAPAICMESVLRFVTKLTRPKVPVIPYSIVTRSKSLQGRKASGESGGKSDRNNNAY